MDEILPGVFHWTAFHPSIRQPVSSYCVVAAGSVTLVDPMLPEGGIDSLRELGPPERIVLTNRHHRRQIEEIVEAFGCPVLVQRLGLHEFEHGPSVEPFDFGDELAPGLTALELGVLTPEETVLELRAGDGALAFADALIRPAGRLGFVPDFLLGDDPEAIKSGLRTGFADLLERDFDNLLFAHGEPLVGGARDALARFAGEAG